MLALLPLLIFLTSSCAGNLFAKLSCDVFILLDFLVSGLLSSHFINPWVTFVAFDVWHLSVFLDPVLLDCGPHLELIVVVLFGLS